MTRALRICSLEVDDEFELGRLGLRGLLRYHALVGGRLEVHVTSERHGIPEGKYLRGPITAKAVLAVDPIEQIGQSSPAERACRAAGRRFLVVDHERVAP